MFRKSTSWKQIIRDKGFYVALAVCVLAVAVVAAVSLADMLPRAEQNGDEPGVTTTAPTAAPTTAPTSAQQVQIPVTSVADLRTTTSTAKPTTTISRAEEPQDLYVLPLSNEVCEPFSNGEMVYSETMQDWRTHNGVDFTGEHGKYVKAAAEGRITVIETDEMWGDVIEIDHGFGIVTRYCGVSARNILVGDTVKVGQQIGVLTAIPCESAEVPHLHFEVTASGKPLDAVAVIGVDVRYKKN